MTPSVESSPKILLDETGLAQKIEQMADALSLMIEDPEQTAIIGIKRRGAILAERLRALIAERHGYKLPLGSLDITLYRDDLSQLAPNPLVGATDMDFGAEDRTVLLIDDVLYTGRTVRSALTEIIDFGRPRAVKLAVLVDRGHREFPIQADYSALTIETLSSQVVKVCLQECDGREEVILAELSSLSSES